MENISALLCNLIYLILWILDAAIWARVILGCFSAGKDTVLSRMLIFITDPLILPWRAILGRAKRTGMLDLSALIGSAVVCAAVALLPSVTL